MILVRQNSCRDRPADGASGTLRTVPQGRRAVLKAALGLGLCFSFFDGAFARGEDPKTAHPQEGDQFVFSSGDRDGQLVTPEYLPLGGPQQLALSCDHPTWFPDLSHSATSVIRPGLQPLRSLD